MGLEAVDVVEERRGLIFIKSNLCVLCCLDWKVLI